MTILYTSDFKRYPTAIVDIKTANKSWVEFAMKLKVMGIKNWGFHLTLLDPTLQGVDPYDETLDKHTIRKIQVEASNNYWYFLREIFRVPSKVGGDPIYLRANRGNIATFWSVFNSFNTYLEQIRQTGKSLTIRAMVEGYHTCWARRSNHILFTKSDLRADEIKEYKAAKDLLPNYLHYKTSKDKDNQQDFTTLCHGNVTYSYIPTNDRDQANNVGRGKTPTFITVDETPFLRYAQISIPALIASTNDSFPTAEAEGKFHAIFYSNTAGDLSTVEGRYVYEKIRSRGMFFSEMLYDCYDRKDSLELISKNSNSGRAPYITIAFNHRQLGYTDEELKAIIDRVPFESQDQMKRDSLGIWTYGSQENPIPEKLLNKARENINSDFRIHRINDNYLVRLHKPLEYIKCREVIMGLDTSEAINRDAIAGVGIDVRTLETLFAFTINETNLITFGSFLAKFLEEFPKVTLIGESKSSWAGIRDQLLIELPRLGLDAGRRMYSRVVDTARGTDREKQRYSEYIKGYPTESKYHEYRREFGFNTSSSSRDVLYGDVMMNTMKEVAHLIKDPNVINELSTLVERNNRIDHSLSGNDDHVMAFNLAHWFLRYARNLDHYGINPSDVMSEVLVEEIKDPKEIRKLNRKEVLAKEIEEITGRLETSRNEVESSYYLRKLGMLKRELDGLEETYAKPVSSLDVGANKNKENIYSSRRRMGGMFSRFIGR